MPERAWRCSWLDDAARGGDVDVLVGTPDEPTLQQRALAAMEPKDVSQLPANMLAAKRGEDGTAFVQAVQARILLLEVVA